VLALCLFNYNKLEQVMGHTVACSILKLSLSSARTSRS
jgi:hypothetical protein